VSRSTLFRFVFASCAAPLAAAAEFTANNLFVADRVSHSIRELDPAGNVVRVFAGSLLVDPQAMAFGADGMLYVLDERGSLATFDRIVVISPDGDLVAEGAVGPAVSFDASGARIIAGARGRVLVSDAIGAEVHDFDFDGGIVRTFSGAPLGGTPALALGPESHYIFSGGGDPVAVAEYEANGTLLDSETSPPTGGGLPAPLIARGPDGVVYRLTRPASGSGATLDALFAAAPVPSLVLSGGPFVDFLVGPDDKLWLLANGGLSIMRVSRDLATVETLPYSPAPSGAAFAFAPFRFALKLGGTASLDGDLADSLVENGVELTYFAGVDRVFITLPDDPDDLSELADYYGAGAMPFAGFAIREVSGKKVRFHGTFAERHSTLDQSATVRVRFEGKTDATSGFFRVNDVRGDVVFGLRGLMFAGSIRSAKRLE
jgi:streptogramin lyase